MENWEFNVLGIYNYNLPGKLDNYFKFIVENHKCLDGELVEAGVFNGKSILATGLLLKELGSKKKVYGFDTFIGFPPIYAPPDQFDGFDTLLSEGRISEHHHEQARKLRNYRELLTGRSPNPETISTSGDFSRANLEQLKKKIDFLGIASQIELVEGPFEESMSDNQKPARIVTALIDCDLYESYRVALGYIWKRLVIGGYVFLDEYYSLKFPGARTATDEFCEALSDKPQMHLQIPGEFERWFLVKRHAD